MIAPQHMPDFGRNRRAHGSSSPLHRICVGQPTFCRDGLHRPYTRFRQPAGLANTGLLESTSGNIGERDGSKTDVPRCAPRDPAALAAVHNSSHQHNSDPLNASRRRFSHSKPRRQPRASSPSIATSGKSRRSTRPTFASSGTSSFSPATPLVLTACGQMWQVFHGYAAPYQPPYRCPYCRPALRRFSYRFSTASWTLPFNHRPRTPSARP